MNIFLATLEHPVTDKQILQRHNLGAALPLSREVKLSLGYDEMLYATQPAAQPGYRIEAGPHALVEGRWSTSWVQVAKTVEEVAAELAAWRETLECSPYQGEETLAAHTLTVDGQQVSLLALVETMLDHIDTPEKIRRAFRRATVWRRTSEATQTMLAGMGLTPEQGDALFVEAREVVV